MSFFTFLTETDDQYKDLDIDTQVVCDKGPLTSAYLINNTALTDISIPYISAAYSGAVDLNISIDRGATTSWNQIMVINHTFPASGTFTIASGTTSAVSNNSDTMSWREFDVYFRTASTRTHRYIRITLHDPVTASHSISIGRIMIGLATTLTSNFNYDWELARKVLNKTTLSETNTRSTNRIVEYKELVLTFEEMTDAQLLSLTTFTDALHGDAVYAFIVPDPQFYNGYLMHLTSEVREIHNRRHRLPPLTFTEVSRGVRNAS
jgi:hypothetical protein